jgi:hypothetical protein
MNINYNSNFYNFYNNNYRRNKGKIIKNIYIKSVKKEIDMKELNSLVSEEEKNEYIREILFNKIENNIIIKNNNITKDQITIIIGMIIELPHLKEVIKTLQNI